MSTNQVKDPGSNSLRGRHLDPKVAEYLLCLRGDNFEHLKELEALPTLDDISDGGNGIDIQALMVWFQVYSNLTMLGLRNFAQEIEDH